MTGSTRPYWGREDTPVRPWLLDQENLVLLLLSCPWAPGKRRRFPVPEPGLSVLLPERGAGKLGITPRQIKKNKSEPNESKFRGSGQGRGVFSYPSPQARAAGAGSPWLRACL